MRIGGGKQKRVNMLCGRGRLRAGEGTGQVKGLAKLVIQIAAGQWAVTFISGGGAFGAAAFVCALRVYATAPA